MALGEKLKNCGETNLLCRLGISDFVSRFARCNSKQTYAHAGISRAGISRDCGFWLAHRVNMCDINHIPQTFAQCRHFAAKAQVTSSNYVLEIFSVQTSLTRTRLPLE